MMNSMTLSYAIATYQKKLKHDNCACTRTMFEHDDRFIVFNTSWSCRVSCDVGGARQACEVYAGATFVLFDATGRW